MTALIDLTGKRFGKLIVIFRSKLPISRHVRWIVKCEGCGGLFACFIRLTPKASNV